MVADVESKPLQGITPAPDADPLFGPVASELVRYLASIAMTAIATVVAVGVDSKVTIPNLSLVFVVPVIIAGVSLGLGPSLCSAILGALAVSFQEVVHSAPSEKAEVVRALAIRGEPNGHAQECPFNAQRSRGHGAKRC